MFLNQRRTRDYTRELARKYNLSQQQVSQILHYGLAAMAGAMQRREEVQVRGRFTLYLDKEIRYREIRRWQRKKASTPSALGAATCT